MKPVSQRVGSAQSIAAAMLKAGLVDEILAFVTASDGSGIIPAFIISEQGAYKITTASYNPCSLAKMVAQYGDRTKKLGVVVRSCDARAIIELSKLKQLDLDNIYLIGIECYGTASLEEGLGMGLYIYPDRMEVDGVERVWDERLIRPNCLRCEYPIPSMADVSLSIDERSPCISVFSDKGSQVLEAAGLSAEGENVRDLDSLRARATQWQERHFKDLGGMAAGDRLSYWLSLFERCIKCYGCRDSCPLCCCRECAMEPDGGWVRRGTFPPDMMFHLIRLIHVAPHCVNCGQCESVCPAGIPVSKLYHMLGTELADIFHYEAGIDVNVPPPLATIGEGEPLLDEVSRD